VKLRRKDGSSYHARLSLAAVRLQGRPCWQAVVEDVDERKRIMLELEARNAELARANEELARLHRAKDEFVATISHELRTPLVTGIGYLDLLLEGKLGSLSARAEGRMRIALRNLKRLSRLIDDLLDYNRVVGSTQRYAPVLGPVDLAAVVGECATEFLARTKRRGVDLRVELVEGLPPVRADAELLRTVIANLLDNADRHGGELAQIRIAARAEGGRVVVSVSDDGHGMEPEVRAHAFEPFFKSQESREGLGLGLSIVRQILEAHGAEVGLESTPDTGTTVTFSLAAAERSGS
jgi:signal transduction histidine kinase